ncbi:MAG: hypothetical protein GY754_17480 [bacterium]|nr:hypothetical protein [bacterium]
MIYNPASRILGNILLNNFEIFAGTLADKAQVAFSSIMDGQAAPPENSHIFSLKTSLHEIDICIIANDFTPEEENAFSRYLQASSKELTSLLSILLKKAVAVEYRRGEAGTLSGYKQVDAAVRSPGAESYISILLPIPFFRLFSRQIKEDSTVETIEEEILLFFKNPVNLFPGLKLLLEVSDEVELGELINQLQRMNSLTTYQLFLMINSFPEHSIKIKRGLSKNRVRDVLEEKKRYTGSNSITRRDLAMGVYTVEEAIYFLMKSGIDFGFSRFMVTIQENIRRLMNIELLFKKDFRQWIDEMIKKNLLYKTLSICDDMTIAGAVSGNETDRNEYLDIFKQYISKRKLDDIRSLSPEYRDIINARLSFVLNFRKERIKMLNPDHESLDYLLVGFQKESDYLYLLLGVGWSVLSTALKGLKKKNRDRVLDSLPYAVKFLIEDILRGIVNPNILHDEIQINKAKRACVNSIKMMYEEGIIEVE